MPIIWDVICMATSSILKDVTIKDRQRAHTFVEALHEAENKRFEHVAISRKCSEIKGDKIKDFFGKR